MIPTIYKTVIRGFIPFLCTIIVLTAEAQTKELKQLASDTKKAIKKGLLNKADSLCADYVLLFQKYNFQKDFDYSEMLSWKARRLSQKGRIDDAITIQKEIIAIRDTASDCTTAQSAPAVSDLASYYSQKGDYNKAIEIGHRAKELFQEIFGEKHHFYGISLSNLASYYSHRGQQGDYEKAVSLGEAAMKCIKKKTPEYANNLNSLVVFYTQTGNSSQANKLTKKAIKATNKYLADDNISKAIIFNNNATRLTRVGNYERALEFVSAAKDIYDKEGRTFSLPYSKMLANMATICTHLQKNDEAIQLLEQALPIIEKTAGKQHPDYLRCISDLSAAYRNIGNMEKSDELAHESERVSQQMGGQDNIKYARSLSKQASTFASNGNYSRAIEQELKAYNIFENRKDSINMASSMGLMANYLFANGEQERAFDMAEKSLDIFRKRNDSSVFYAQALNNSSILYYNGNNYDQASQYGLQAMKIYQQLGDTTNTIYARIMANNALFLFVKGQVKKATAIAQHAVDLHRSILGDDHYGNVPLLYNLSVYQMTDSLWQPASKNYRQALELQSDMIRTNFLHLTSQERENLWRQKSYVFRYAPLLAYQNRQHLEQDSLLAIDAYNAILFTKGILLNSDIDFRNLLKRTGDHQLLNKYNKLELLRHEATEYYKMPQNQRNETDLKRIKEEIYQLERSLVRGCKEYGSFTENLNISVEQVRQSLANDEAAIEFADFYLNGVGTTYIALLLRKDSPTPRLIRLFSEADLKDLSFGNKSFREALKNEHDIDLLYNNPQFGTKLWEPIMKHLDGVKKIYFTPTEIFYHLGIEYLPCDSVNRIGDLYSIYRLSSTKQLTQRKTEERIKSATIYGGLNYDMELTQLKEQHQSIISKDSIQWMAYEARHDETNFPNNLAEVQRTLDSLTVRGSVRYLEGTEYEALNIAEQLMQNDIDTHVLMQQEGTEESFKALSGSNQTIIHIATHGFSFSPSDIKNDHHKLVFLNEETDDIDNMLNYSGLLLSGANYVLKGGKMPNDIEDGVLTAREIAQVDLGKVDMVVLSACQTALGEIREDGVFGIQRGFKKAGARSLLMSLWKVNDQATSLMMTDFYKHLTAGYSRHEAFSMAQQTIRKQGFSSPYYWASFILLDDI